MQASPGGGAGSEFPQDSVPVRGLLSNQSLARSYGVWQAQSHSRACPGPEGHRRRIPPWSSTNVPGRQARGHSPPWGGRELGGVLCRTSVGVAVVGLVRVLAGGQRVASAREGDFPSDRGRGASGSGWPRSPWRRATSASPKKSSTTGTDSTSARSRTRARPSAPRPSVFPCPACLRCRRRSRRRMETHYGKEHAASFALGSFGAPCMQGSMVHNAAAAAEFGKLARTEQLQEREVPGAGQHPPGPGAQRRDRSTWAATAVSPRGPEGRLGPRTASRPGRCAADALSVSDLQVKPVGGGCPITPLLPSTANAGWWWTER